MLLMIGAGSSFSQPSLAATASTSLSRPSAIKSWYCLEVLNCAAMGGVPPTMRLIACERAASPPATAESTHTPPAFVKALANSWIAADSPPDVHQWITSALFCAAACGAARTVMAAHTALTTGLICGFIVCLLLSSGTGTMNVVVEGCGVVGEGGRCGQLGRVAHGGCRCARAHRPQVHSLAGATLSVWRGRAARCLQGLADSSASPSPSIWRTPHAACPQPEQL